jgi:thiamine-monophosphate kinase
MIVEGVDFLAADDASLVGRKALAVCMSDIAACGGVPRYCLVSLGLARHTAVGRVDRLSEGMRRIAADFDVNIVGGDISRAGKLTIDVSMLGIVEKKNLVLRSGARAGDVIFCTGSFGGSRRGKHLTFTPRLSCARYLVERYKVNAMIDVSDGLLADLGHIMAASNRGAVLYEDCIPFAAEARDLSDALSSGEDFELLFTMPLAEARRLRAKTQDFTAIGEIVGPRHGLTVVDRAGKKTRIKPSGYTHF